MASGKLATILVHLLTASGSVCGLLALHFAAVEDWRAAFLWLGIALVVDGIDGPIARRIDTSRQLPRFSGVTLDETVDFLNYVVVPSFILLQSDILRPSLALAAATVILLSSLFHFADGASKTEDGYFVGFPAVWNLTVFYMFVFGIGEVAAFGLTLACAILTFVPMKWVHPLRVKRMRAVTLSVMAGWTGAAIFALTGEFPSPAIVQIIFAVSALYLLVLGISRSFADRKDR